MLIDEVKLSSNKIIPIDLNFLGNSNAIAVFLIPHQNGALLVESGPASTLTALEAGLNANGFTLGDITDLLLTHIHLDHAGAAGYLAKQGARIHVHEVGAPHLIDPSRLLASAERIYQDQMDRLWGETIPVPRSQVYALKDGAEILVGGLCFQALDTPGHANHHIAYQLESICFSGDVGGVRRPGIRHLELPLPPPEVDLQKWATSIRRIEQLSVDTIAPTHFGLFQDVSWHLGALKISLEKIEKWMEGVMREHPPKEIFRQLFTDWAQAEARADGLSQKQIEITSSVNPSWMSADGLFRYWEKIRQDKDWRT